MKNLKKLVAIFISVILIIGASVTSFAAPSVGTTCYIDVHTKCLNSKTGTQYRLVNTVGYLFVRNDGAVCYCIEPGQVFTRTFYRVYKPTDNSFWKSFSDSVRENVSLAVMFGFPGRTAAQMGASTNHDAYAATQAVIWEYLLGERTSHTDPMGKRGRGLLNTPAETAYWNILANIGKYKSDSRYVKNAENNTELTVLTSASSSTEQALILFKGKAPEYPIANGKIQIYKKDSDGNKLSGAEFTVFNFANKQVGKIITNSDGYAVLERLEYGKYTVVETKFPTNYYAGNYATTHSVTINSSTPNATVTVNAVNEIIPGGIKIVKTSEDGEIEGISFTLKGNGVDKTVTTGKNGEIITDNLKPGTYTVTEQNHDKYVPQETRRVTVVPGKTATVTFNNVLKRGSLKVIKSSEDGFTEGIKFKLSGVSLSGHKVEQYAVTNSSGIATFNDVLITGHSEYVLEEIDTDERYIVPEKQSVAVEWNKVTEKTVFNWLKRGDLKVIKTSEDNFVQGARFRLYGTSLSGAFIDEYAVVGNDGTALFENIPIGSNYTVEEADTDIKYVIPKAQDAVIEWNKVTEKAFKNILKKFRVDAFKIDAELNGNKDGEKIPMVSPNITSENYDYPYGATQGNATLEGAVYGLYRNGTLLDSYTTDRNGYFITDYFVCGEGYYIQEISPSEGYLLDTSKYYINCTADKYTVELNTEYLDVTEEIIKGKIGIAKHTDDGGTKIETPEVGAIFEVYLKSYGSYKNAESTERDKLVIGNDGFALSKDLPYGVYTVHQTKGTEGRELLPDFDVAVTKDGFVYRYIINNADFKSYIKITKTDSTTGKVIPYAGAGFKLYAPDGTQITMKYTYPKVSVIDVFYTTADGTLITPEPLPYGNGYSLVEVQANYGYVLDSTPLYFDVLQENSTTESDITVVNVTKGNRPQMGRIIITKSGETFYSVTEKNGIYQPVYKVTGLKGAVFSVYAAEDTYTPDGTLRYKKGEKVDTVTTDKDGKAGTKELYLGKYLIKEDKAPFGTVLNDKAVNVELSYAGQEISITTVSATVNNERQKIVIDLVKVMEKDEIFKLDLNGEVKNVKFGLYAAEVLTAADGKIIPKDGLIETVNCSADGKAVFSTDIPVGSKLYVKEILTDNSYILSNRKYAVEFVYAGDRIATVLITVNNGESIVNKLIRGSVEGLKTDENRNAVEGAEFGLFSADTTEFTKENAILTTVSESDGKFRFNNLPCGKWLIKELAVGPEYILSDEIFTAEIKTDGEVIKIEAVNELVIGGIKITKTDKETGNRLSGAVFEVYRDINNNRSFDERIDPFVGTLTESETDKGIYSFDNLRYGGYFLREAKSPKYYLANGKYHYFSISENGKTVTLETAIGKGFENIPYKGNIKVIKKDADTGKPLSGVEFGLFDAQGNETVRGTTDENGELVFGNIRYGKYCIRELTPKEGYLKSDKAVEVEISEDGQTYSFEFTNKKIPKQPKTGDTANIGLWLVMLFASLLSASVIFLFGRKAQKK